MNDICNELPDQEPRQRRYRRLRLCLLVVGALQLSACSKTVQWEEEVPLNTGETIWVKRSVTYQKGGDAGNPFRIIDVPIENGTVTEINWQGKRYRFDRHHGAFVLAISPQGVPVFVAHAEDGSWSLRNHYGCTTPFYVQFIPDASGSRWSRPSRIEPWLYHLEANLLLNTPQPDSRKNRYTVADRMWADRLALEQRPSWRRVMPDFTGDLCKRKENQK